MKTRVRWNESKYLMTLVGTYLAFSMAALAAEGHFDRTLQVTGPVEVTIRTGAGTIVVRPGSDSTLHVHGSIRAGEGLFSSEKAEKEVHYLEAHPPIEQNGDVITIGAITESRFLRNVSISYELTVPPATRLKSQTGSGDQTIEGISGPLEASTGSGSISASNIGNDVHASTGSGEIALESVKGSVRASTGSGAVRALGAAGNFRASTGSGSVTLEQTEPAAARVTTGSGDIELRGARGLVYAKTTSGSITVEGGGTEPWNLETVSGNITVRLSSNSGFALQAHTVSGSITSKRPLTVQGRANRREMTGKAGEGGLPLDVSTVSGNIQID